MPIENYIQPLDPVATRSKDRSWSEAMVRGGRHACPSCGDGALYSAYLKINDACPSCDEALHHHRADDAPPYFTIFIVGHIVLGAVLSLEQAMRPPAWIHLAVFLPLTVVFCALLLPRIKGALVGLQWAFRMHGFAGALQDDGPLQPAAADRVRLASGGAQAQDCTGGTDR